MIIFRCSVKTGAGRQLMRLPFLLIVIFLFHSSCAQVSPDVMIDSASVPPNTVRVMAKIISSGDKEMMVQVTKFIGSGQGIINVLSEGQKIIVPRNDQGSHLKPGREIQVDLKEKLDIDGAKSSYVILRVRED